MPDVQISVLATLKAACKVSAQLSFDIVHDGILIATCWMLLHLIRIASSTQAAPAWIHRRCCRRMPRRVSFVSETACAAT